MSYPSRGIAFTLPALSGKINGVTVFSAAGRDVGTRSTGERIAAGTGAYGIVLEQSEKVSRLPDPTLREVFLSSGIQTSNAYLLLQYDERSIAISSEDGKVVQIEIRGKFTTTNGITNLSNQGDVVKAFGLAEVFFVIPPHSSSRRTWSNTDGRVFTLSVITFLMTAAVLALARSKRNGG